MTSLIAWVAADQRGPSSLNLATDSRITWSDSSGREQSRWDQTQKVFASQHRPLLVGYVGDVLFPALALPHLLTRIDRGIRRDGDSPTNRLVEGIRRLARDYPTLAPFTVYIAHRTGELMPSTFGLTALRYGPRSGRAGATSQWSEETIEIPTTSSVITIDGSGGAAVRDALDIWSRASGGWTSRVISSGFVDALLNGKDSKSGGAPQLGALYRRGPGQLLGVVHEGLRYFAGGQLLGDEELSSVQWHNEDSERTDGASKRRLAGAQPQPRPSGLPPRKRSRDL